NRNVSRVRKCVDDLRSAIRKIVNSLGAATIRVPSCPFVVKVIRMQKISAFLWFDSQAEAAAKFYVGIFKNSKLGRITRYDDEVAEKIGRPAGSVMTVEFQLEGVEFVALNGGPPFKFTEAISFSVNCETQDE